MRPGSVAIALLSGWLLAFGGVAQATQPGGGGATRYLMLVLESESVANQVAADLADMGFDAPEPISGLHPRYGAFRQIEVASADAQTRHALLSVNGVKSVRDIFTDIEGEPRILLTDEVVVKVVDGAVGSVASKHGCVVRRQFQQLSGVYILRILNESSGDALSIAAAIAGEPGVEFAHPHRLMRVERLQVAEDIEDPFFRFQWHLHNTGQIEGAVPDADIDALEAWEITRGEGAIIGVIDDGSQPDHEDLAANYLTGYDFVDQDSDPSPTRLSQTHGIRVTGLACARANSVGVRGVAPFARFIGCKIGLGADFTSDEDIADAFLFCERNGAMAINNSWGGPGRRILPGVPNTLLFPQDVIDEAVETVATTGRRGLGVLVLFASGNSSNQISDGNIRAARKHAAAIGATFRNDTLTCYSCYGPEQSVVAPASGSFDCVFPSYMVTTDVQARPDLIDAALGLPILGENPPKRIVIDPFTGDPILVDDPSVWDLSDFSYTRQMNGTSAACPVATGVAALIFSLNSGYTSYQARNVMEHTADKVVGIDGPFDAVTGHNPFLGHGRVNAHRAALAAANQLSWPSPVERFTADATATTVVLNWDLPDWNGNGVPDFDVDRVLVVQGPKGGLNWSPTDGVIYQVGQQVAPGVFVIENDLVDTMTIQNVPVANYDYAVWVASGEDFYSWGRRALFGSDVPVIDDGGPDAEPGASISVMPAMGIAPLSVSFAGGGIDPNNRRFLSFNWNFGDQTTGTGSFVTHTYNSPGTYVVTLSAITSNGTTVRSQEQVRVFAAENRPPRVNIRPITPTSGVAPLVVVMEAIAFDPDPDGAIVSYGWDLGDGTTAVGSVAENAYASPGTYVVTLTVTDDRGGRGQTTQIIKVFASGGGAVSPLTDTAGAPLAAISNCGNGASLALVGSAVVMLTAIGWRRRRG